MRVFPNAENFRCLSKYLNHRDYLKSNYLRANASSMIRNQREILRVTTDAEKNGVDGIGQTALENAIVNGGEIVITP